MDRAFQVGNTGYAVTVPDWFYRTVTRPVLFRMPVERAQSLACGFLGRVGDLPCGVGGALIDFLGHMRPDAQLSIVSMGRTWIGPVGRGAKLDGSGVAARAWTHFGFSFVEFGPVTDLAQRVDGLTLRESPHSLCFKTAATFTPELLMARLRGLRTSPVHIIVRLRSGAAGTPEEAAGKLLVLAKRLESCAELFSVELGGGGVLPDWSEGEWRLFWRTLKLDRPHCSWLLVVPLGGVTFDLYSALVDADGAILDGLQESDGFCQVGEDTKPLLLSAINKLRERMGALFPIIASGGIHQPSDAKEVLDAGATLVQVDTGLIFSGPGLPKRINEAILSTLPILEVESETRPARQSWFWMGAMGLGMLIGSIMALVIALTRVVLPYDEAYCGITRAQLAEINDRLLPFMAHDRVTLAGTMIAIGLLYLNFSWFGIRYGEHWAKVAVSASATVGFFSFFLFLGFGYFDPFHGFVTAVLFQLFLQGMVGDLSPRRVSPCPDWNETKEWRRAQWGQLLLVIHGVGLLGAGLVICSVGIGEVFVSTDLEYLQTDLGSLRAANDRLIPLVAHDRATLGGMLLASGIVYLLGALWGLRRDSMWLWCAFFWSGLAAYTCAIGVHFGVGYLDWVHLLPAFAGLVLLMTGLGLSLGWMRASPQAPCEKIAC